MTKYHISPETGRPNICKADKKPCPLGEDKPHFETKEAAREHYEKNNASKTITKPLTKNNPSDKNRASPQLAKELKFLSKHKDWYVRRDVADNLKTPANVLEALSKDEDGRVRYIVARNPSTPPRVLVKLSKDKDSSVRNKVGRNRSTPINVLENLSKDYNPYVREAVASNPNTPVLILERLSNDRNPNVRETATRTLEELKYSSDFFFS